MRWAYLMCAAVAIVADRPQHGLPALTDGASRPAPARDCNSTGPDSDGDGLSDSCEAFLAAQFAPELRVDTTDCSWNGGARVLAGGYFHVVHPLNSAGDSIRLIYLPAYFRDCGWRGFQKALRFGRSNAHAGDSELIVVDVRREQADRWLTTAVFLSAHCYGRSDGRCRWFRGDELAEFEWVVPSGAPRVWVARDKHANYPSRRACESGHWAQESCSEASVSYRFPTALADQNLGSRMRPRFGPRGCVRSEELPFAVPGAQSGTSECFWSTDDPFRGWQGNSGGSATPYGLLLQRIAGL